MESGSERVPAWAESRLAVLGERVDTVQHDGVQCTFGRRSPPPCANDLSTLHIEGAFE